MSRGLNITIYFLIVVLSFSVLSGCGNSANDTAIIGAAVGAGIGAITGGDTSAVVIGSTIGAGAGYYLGDQFGNNKDNQVVRKESRRYFYE